MATVTDGAGPERATGMSVRWRVAIAVAVSAGLWSALALAASWRFAALVLLLSVLIGTALLLAHIVERHALPLLERAVTVMQRWLQRHDGRLTRRISGMLEGFGADLPLIVLFAGAAMGGLWLFLGMLEDVVTGDALVAVDRTVFHLLQSLRSQAGDAMLVAVTELGDRQVVTAVVIAAAAGLLLLRRWWATIYLVIAALGSTLFVQGLKLVLHRPRPLALYDGISEFSFPSGHATSSVVIYGFLAILLARFASPTMRRALVFGTLSLVALIAFSRLYLGAHWLSDVGAGLAFGTAWITALAILCFRHDREPLPATPLTGLVVAVVVTAGAWHIAAMHATDMARYAPPVIGLQSKDGPR